MKEGAAGYLTKDVDINELQGAINAIVEDGYYYNDHLTGKLITTLKDINYSKDHHHRSKVMLATKALTEKEKEVLKYFATDLSYKDIAEKMDLSLRTIEGYRDALFNKLDAISRTGVVVNAIKYGVLEFHEL